VTLDEVQRLYKRFVKLDKDNSGTIDKEEFLGIPGINNNPLAQRYILKLNIPLTEHVCTGYWNALIQMVAVTLTLKSS
jgi:Ca2+-binding EF-hand superfamily protein